jgi:hypothetical protein
MKLILQVRNTTDDDWNIVRAIPFVTDAERAKATETMMKEKQAWEGAYFVDRAMRIVTEED